MNKLIAVVVALCLPAYVMASGGHHNEYIVDAPININDKVSLQRGAQIFVNNCMGCHSARFMRYERVSTDLEIPAEIMKQNLLFTTDKIGETMLSSIPPELAENWFGAVPPDLSLTARLRGSDWLYSYLTNFYADESRPWRVNNHVFPGVGMPYVMSNMEKELGEKEFKTAMADLTNYMVYMSEPIRAERERIGVYVLIFLAIFFIPVYFLNREYWKGIH